MDADEAEAKLRRELLRPLDMPLRAVYRDRTSLGSAASHGCVRMSIPDVEELYDQVEIGTPIFIG